MIKSWRQIMAACRRKGEAAAWMPATGSAMWSCCRRRWRNASGNLPVCWKASDTATPCACSLFCCNAAGRLPAGLAETDDPERQLTALGLLRYLDHPGVVPALRAWLSGRERHPLVQFCTAGRGAAVRDGGRCRRAGALRHHGRERSLRWLRQYAEKGETGR